MTTILDVLHSISAYPIPQGTLHEVSLRRGVSLLDDASEETLTSKEYKLCKADLLVWLSLAPNVTQGGQSYSFTDEQRKAFRQQADTLYEECDAEPTGVVYGYKGSRL